MQGEQENGGFSPVFKFFLQLDIFASILLMSFHLLVWVQRINKLGIFAKSFADYLLLGLQGEPKIL